MTVQEKRAAAARRNYLLRVLAVQRLYQAHKVEGMPDAFVFRKHIAPTFCIGERTFRNYMGINARKELKVLGVEVDAPRGGGKG